MGRSVGAGLFRSGMARWLQKHSQPVDLLGAELRSLGDNVLDVGGYLLYGEVPARSRDRFGVKLSAVR
jgi:hypothetical protein